MKNSLTNNTLRDMKNYMRYISLFLMIIGMSISSLNTASAATAASGTYTLVKGVENSEVLETGEYIIGWYYSTGMYFAPGFSSSGAQNMDGVTHAMSGSHYVRNVDCTVTLDGSEGICEWTITDIGLNTYTIHDGTYYMCGQSDSKNKLQANTSATNAEWSIRHTGSTTYTACVVRNDAVVTYDYLGYSKTKMAAYDNVSSSKIYFFKKTADLYDINKVPDASGTASMDAQVGGVSVTKAAEDATVALSQTAKPNYRFDGWIVLDENSDEVTVTSNQFTMPASDVWVYPQYTACGTNATVTAASSADVSQTTATIRCASGISSQGDSWCAITEYGFVISAKATNATPAIGGSGVTKHQIGTSYPTLRTGFSKALTGLTASTTYCVRAYAINGHGTAYSAVHEFTTSAEVQYGNYVITCDDYHTVTYSANTEDAYTGSLPTDANEYTSGQTVYMSDGTLSRTGYEFVGWNTNSSATTAITEFVMGSSNVTIYAIWSPIDYTLTMATSVGGGAGTTVSDAAITSPRTGAGTVADKHYREEITVAVVAPAHHTFTGWSSSNGGTFANDKAASTTFTMPAGNTTVTASFTEDTKYTVTWSDNGETSTEQVYSGETTTFPSLMSDCDLYVATGWVQDNSNTFVSETMTAPGTIYAVDATTPTVSANVIYKAVYRHKVYTNDEFELNTTLSGGYYLSANPGTVRYSGTKNGSKLNTVTSTATAVPVYLEKEETGKYSFKLVGVSGEQYLVGNSSADFSWQNTKTGDYKWTVAAGDKGKGDWHIVNAGTNNTRGIVYNNGSGNYIGNYAENNVTAGGTTYYDINFVPAYYYMYSPTAACYTITIASNAFGRGDFATIDGSHKLQGNELTVTPHCGYAINSVNISNGTFTATNNDLPSNEAIKYTIIPTGACTFTVNFTTENDAYKHTISFLDGATTLSQTKTAAIKACGSVTLPNGYNTASGAGGACSGWTFDGWTKTEYTFGQMVEPSGILAAESSQTVTGDDTWYAVYHKTFAAGDYFNIMYGDKYILNYGSNQFSTTTTVSEALQFGMENDYLYYLDKVTRAKKWVYFVGPSGQNVTVSDDKPTSNSYKTTFSESGGTYDIVCNNKHLKLTGDNVKFLTTASGATKPNASGFTAYYPKTDCAIEYVTVTYDAGAGNSCSPASVSVEAGATFTLPVESDITYDKTDWTFVGWSESVVTGVIPGAPADLIAGGGSFSTFIDVTLHAVYSQVPPDGTFDNSKGGRYIIWGEDGGINYYAKSNNQAKGKLSNTLSCSQAAIFELVETETAGEYKIHIVGEAKYMGGEGCADANTDFVYVNAKDAPVWTVTETAPSSGLWKVLSTCGNRGFIFETSGSKQFGHYSANNPVSSPSLYKFVHIGQCDDYYTTNPNKALNVTGNVKVTSTNGRMIMAKDQLTVNAENIGAGATITVTSNSSDVYFSLDRNANIAKAAANQPKPSVDIVADGSGNVTQTVYVHYMPSVSTNGIENVTVSVSSAEKTSEATIKVRHLPATFAIAAKVGTSWYALTGNMNGAKTPKAIQIDVDESTWTAYAPDTCAYQLWPVKTTNGSGDRYALQGGNAYGERVRFSAVNNETTANAGLWANNSSSGNTINNNAAITAISSDPAGPYEWKIEATEVSGTWKYTLQTDQSNNTNKLNIHRDADLVWGTYSDGQAVTSDIYLLPISEITPFEMKVVEWYPTKMLIQTANAISSPTVKIAGETIAGATCTGKGTNLYEIGNLALEANPTNSLNVQYTSGLITYSAVKTIPVIISRSTLSLNNGSGLNEPFATLTNDVYQYADLVVRDGAVLTVNGTSAQNTFYDVIIYPTSKISVPATNVNSATNKLNVHSLTFFGGIDEIYNGSSYDLNKYGVPELSLKGQFGTKTVTTINYDMRVDLSQMYSLTVPYDVALANITYWDGTAMTPGTNLYVSAYDGAARAAKSGKTWIYETDFATKLGAATLKQGVGYTISAELQSGVGNTYSIIRMPMTSNVAANNTEAAKTVAVTAHGKGSDVSDNHKGWNLVGNPYMVSISGGEPDAKLVVGKLVESGTGPWDWDGEIYPYRYVTIPDDDGRDYHQEKFSDATLKPFKNFFIQIETSGDLAFALASRQNAPARYLQAQEREVEFEVLLGNESRSDHTGLLIAEKYSPAYEINADLEKMENAMSVYTIYGGYKLAYNALSPADAEEAIPVGYIANAEGSYTFRLDERSNVDDVEHIWLIDYETSETTDLLYDTYEFETAKGRNETRFALSVGLKKQPAITTDIDDIRGDSDHPIKFLYRDKIYILRGGQIYDTTGKQVREIK